MSDFTSKWTFDFKFKVYDLLRADTNDTYQRAGRARRRVSVTAPIYPPSIHHLRSCRNRPRPWLTEVHSQVGVFHTTTSKRAPAGGKKNESDGYKFSLWLQFDQHSVQTCLGLTCTRWTVPIENTTIHVHHKPPRSQNSSILDLVYTITGSVTHYSTALVHAQAQNVASCFISLQKNKRRHIKAKCNEKTFAPQHDTTCARNLCIIAAACHTMSLSTQGKEALRNVHDDLACVSVRVRVKQGQLLNLAAFPNNLQWIVPEVRCFTLKTRYCHQVMELTHVSLGLARISRRIHTGVVAWACCEGGQEVLWGFEKRKLWSSLISVMQVGFVMSLDREEAFACIYRSTFDYIYHRKQVKHEYYVLMLYLNDERGHLESCDTEGYQTTTVF